ncbi:MAG: glycosyltransferase, partial [Verrucomicrobia bacterium]|nr:glycosyltransferase [Verrucomicrobiota bacterium]
HEGVPQAGLQALACGTPVVGSDTGGIPEIIRHGETGRIFKSGDAAALAAAVREVIEQREQSSAMSTRGRAMVEEHHSLDAMLDKLDALYRRQLG